MSTTTSTYMAASTTAPSPSCTTAVPGKYGNVPLDACNSNYNFDPSFAANLALAVLFGMTTTGHVIQAAIFKKVLS